MSADDAIQFAEQNKVYVHIDLDIRPGFTGFVASGDDAERNQFIALARPHREEIRQRCLKVRVFDPSKEWR